MLVILVMAVVESHSDSFTHLLTPYLLISVIHKILIGASVKWLSCASEK